MPRRYVRIRLKRPPDLARMVSDCRIYALGRFQRAKEITSCVPASLAFPLWHAPRGARIRCQLFRLRDGRTYLHREALARERVVLKVVEIVAEVA